jgi:signal peptidase I
MEQNSGLSSEPSWVQVAVVGRKPRRTLLRAAFLAIACFVLFRLVILPIRVEGISMMPTYVDKKVNFVNRLAYLFHGPRRGDVVSIRTTGLSIMYMKRVVGLPGEMIEFRRGQLYVNEQPYQEPYVKYKTSWTLPPRKLGPGEYYLAGDSRSMSPDLHSQGVVSKSKIVGKVLL